MTQQIQSDIINDQLLNGWVETTLENVIKLIIDHRGLTPKKLGGDRSSSGYRAISAKSIKNGCLVNEEQMNILPEDLYKKWMKEEIDYGDIFLTSEAPLGEHMIRKSEEKLVLSQRIFGIRTNKEKLDPFYFNYFIDSPYYQHELKSKESGSTVTGIKQSELIKTRVICPPLPEQVAIASLLSSFDDKIELLREQNKTLEQTAQTIFQEWFGKYGVDDELPEGWKLRRLGDFIKVYRGFSYKGEFLTNNANTLMVNLGSFKPNDELCNFKSYSGDYKERYILNPGDLVIANTDITQDRAILGMARVVPEIPGKTIIHTHHVYGVKFLESLSKYFILYLTNSFGYRERVESFATGTTVLALPTDAIEDLRFTYNKALIDKFDELIAPIIEKKFINNTQIQSLSQTRDELLPRLMKGEVSVDF